MRLIIQGAILVPLILLMSAYGPGMPNEETNNNQHTQAGIQNHNLGETNISSNGNTDEKQNTMIAVNITIGNEVFPAQFYDNESAQILISQMPLTLHMDDYAGQEKVTRVPYDIPSTATEKPATIYPGEIYLWSGNNLVLFYTTFSNSYGGYVRIGHIENPVGLVNALGNDSIAITLDKAP